MLTDLKFIYDVGIVLDNGRLKAVNFPMRFFRRRIRNYYFWAWFFVVLSRVVGTVCGVIFARQIQAKNPRPRLQRTGENFQCAIYGMLSQSLLKSKISPNPAEDKKEDHSLLQRKQIIFQFITALIEDIPLLTIHLHYEIHVIKSQSVWNLGIISSILDLILNLLDMITTLCTKEQQ